MKLLIILILLSSCYKHEDYSYLNTDRRPYVVIVSERYTNPPITWKPYKIVYDSLSPDISINGYIGSKPDTIYSVCSIDKIDSSFKIEIRKFKIVQP